MNLLLPFLLLPLLACVALLPAWRGATAGRTVIGSYALGTLLVGSGSVHPAELAQWAALDPSRGMFVSLSTGIGIGGMGFWMRRGGLWHLLALPWSVGLLAVFWQELQLMPLLLGAVLGALPLLIGGLVPRNQDVPRTDPVAWQWSRLVVPLVAVVTVVSGITLVTSTDALLPLSAATEYIVGLLALLLATAMIGPWPLHRLAPGQALVPAAVMLVYLIAGSIAPVGIAAALPLVAMLLVPSAILASWHGHYANALGSVALLAIPRPGWQGHGLIALLIVSLLVLSQGNLRFPNRISFPCGALPAVLLTLALASATVAVLTHEVVMGSLLAAGLAAAATRPERRPAQT